MKYLKNILKKAVPFSRQSVKKTETPKQKVGRIGENTACTFLVKHGFTILERNYLKKWGEIDIIAEKSKTTHFVEVKTVSRENIKDVSYETLDTHGRPEENIHPWKMKRLSRTIQSYLLEKEAVNGEWQFDVVAVFLDIKNKEARCRFYKNIIL